MKLAQVLHSLAVVFPDALVSAPGVDMTLDRYTYLGSRENLNQNVIDVQLEKGYIAIFTEYISEDNVVIYPLFLVFPS